MDEFVITGPDKERIMKCKAELILEFEMPDLGNLLYFLGVELKDTSYEVFSSP